MEGNSAGLSDRTEENALHPAASGARLYVRSLRPDCGWSPRVPRCSSYTAQVTAQHTRARIIAPCGGRLQFPTAATATFGAGWRRPRRWAADLQPEPASLWRLARRLVRWTAHRKVAETVITNHRRQSSEPGRGAPSRTSLTANEVNVNARSAGTRDAHPPFAPPHSAAVRLHPAPPGDVPRP